MSRSFNICANCFKRPISHGEKNMLFICSPPPFNNICTCILHMRKITISICFWQTHITQYLCLQTFPTELIYVGSPSDHFWLVPKVILIILSISFFNAVYPELMSQNGRCSYQGGMALPKYVAWYLCYMCITGFLVWHHTKPPSIIYSLYYLVWERVRRYVIQANLWCAFEWWYRQLFIWIGVRKDMGVQTDTLTHLSIQILYWKGGLNSIYLYFYFILSNTVVTLSSLNSH